MNSKSLFFVVSLLLSLHLYADNIKLTYIFETPKFVKNGQYTSIQYNNCRNFGPEGAPSMPHFAAEILLPAGHKIVNVKVESVNWLKSYENIIISPAARPFPLSHKFTSPYVVKPDEEIYNMKGNYPANMIDNEITQYLSGHAIGGFTICPVVYHPSEDKVELIQSITLIIETAETEKSTQSIRNLKQNSSVINRVKNTVDNPQDISKYDYPERSRIDNEVDLLIVSREDLMPGFADFVDYKMSTGFIVELVDVDDIYAEYEGIDKPEKIRNCIIDFYQNRNLTYVVLGGDADGNVEGNNIVPTRGMYGNVGAFTTDYFISADMYYSCLDGNWDDDGDGIYGEVGEEDLLAEVFVGRMSVDNNEELELFIKKIIMYQDQPVVEDIEKSLMLGELLWPEVWAADHKDEVADGADIHGYATAGISDNFNITRMYERDGDWTHQDVFNQFNNEGVNLLNHLGHSNVNYHMTMSNNDITSVNFQNNGIDRGFVINYSQGCYCGAFDNRNPDFYLDEDCFAEEFTNFENGAVACIFNSRSGWGNPFSTDAPSQYFDRQFFDAIFGENITVIGEANADSKSDNIAYINSHDGAIRYCAYALTLFGDPSMDIWTAMPTNFEANYNEAINIGSSQIEVSTGFPAARIALVQNEQLIGRAFADEAGNAIVDFFEPVSSQEPVIISITGHNKNKHEGTIVVLDESPYIGMKEYEYVGTPNFGATITMNAKFKNFAEMGSGFDAQNVVAKLRTLDEYIIINDSIAELGDITAGDSVFIANAFLFTIKDSVPNRHTAHFQVVVTGSEKENYQWTSDAEISLNAPELIVGNMYIDDTATGNGDSILDAGETAIIKIDVSNQGNAPASEVSATVTILNGAESLTFTNTDYSLTDLSIGESKEAVFEVTAEGSVLQGTPVDLFFNSNGANDGQYMAEKEELLVIGFVPEYCESGATTDYITDISEFKFGPLENNSEGECGMYDDYTHDLDLTFEFMAGATYDMDLTIGTCHGHYSQGARVFVDWNYDGDFEDDGEDVFSTQVHIGSFEETDAVTIPSDVVPGPKIVRVVAICTDSVLSINPCGTFYNGATEDYRIIVVPLETPIADFEITPIETTVGDVVELVDMSLNMPAEWEWVITPGVEGTDFEFVNETSVTSQYPQVEFQSAGQYTIELIVLNTEGVDTLTKSNCIIINEITEVPVAGFDLDNTIVNPDELVYLTDLSTNTPEEWEWVISPGTEGNEFSFVEGTDNASENPVVMFNISGFYSIQLVASNIIGDSEPLMESDILEVLPNFMMKSGEVTTCNGNFYDEGGPDGFYYDNSNYEMTFYPAEEGKMIHVDFLELQLQRYSICYDELRIYNGSSSSADIIGAYCGNFLLESVTALNPSGALTFVFESDDFINLPGWTAQISCVDLYDATFLVTAYGQPIAGALVRSNGLSKITNADGEATFSYLQGAYDYLVITSEYGNVSNTFDIVDQDLTINIEMVGMDVVEDAGFKIYPNPAKGSVNIELEKEIGKHQIQIIDMQGREVISHITSQQTNVIDIQSLCDGIYQIIIRNEKYHHVQKFIKL
jgi:PKD repeat protein